MTDNYLIPRANAPLSQGGTAPTREWYNFLRGLYQLYESSDASVQAQITELCYKLGSPDGTIANIPPLGNITSVTGIDSIIANGLNYVQLNLDGDVVTAPALTFYGAITAGSKGWQPYSNNFQKTTTLGVDYLDLVDLADSGAGAFKLLTRDTKGRLSGTKSGAASDVPITNTGWTILTGSNVQTAMDAVDANLVHVVSTGVHYGMRMTINGSNPGAIDISAGNGDILNNSVPSAPTYTTVNFAGQTNITVTNTTAPITYWSIDSAGVVHQSIVAPTPDEFRTSIQLGSTMYNGGVITRVATSIPSAQQAIAQIGDLYEALGFVNYGLYPYANGTNLNFNVTAGRIAAYGANFFVDPLDPNFVSFSAKIPATFRYGTRNSQSPTDVTNVDVSNYDVGGTVTLIPGSTQHSSIHTVWQMTDGAIRVQYGQEFYISLSEALANISTRTFIPNPSYAAEGGIIGAIIAEKGATDLSSTSQAIFVKANKFGEFASGGGSSASVVSFNGRSGVVLPVSGDYTATDVGLSNVDNTSDLNKPVSTAQQTAMNYLGFKNRLFNGDFGINQRSFAGGALSAGTYGFDRWKAGTGGCNVSLSGGVLTHTSGPLVQVIESPNLASQTVTVSVEDPSGSLTVDVDGVSGTITAGSGRRGVSLAVPSGSTGNVTLTLTATSITYKRVQLELGSVATAFEWRPAGIEIELCQRYFELSYPAGYAPGSIVDAGKNSFAVGGTSTSANLVQGQVGFQVKKQSNPTMTIYSPVTGTAGYIHDNNSGLDIVGTAASAGPMGFLWYGTTTGGVAGINCAVHWVASAEL